MWNDSRAGRRTSDGKGERAIGVGFRWPLADWIRSRPSEVDCLEVTAEHFFEGGEAHLRSLAKDFTLFVHGLGLSLGTPGPLDEDTLERFARVVEIADPAWISEHVAFTRSAEVDLGHLNALQPTRETLSLVVEHAQDLSARCEKPLLLENVTSHLRLEGELSEPEFLNRLCEQAGCGLLLDVTNLYINSRNHGFDARKWLHELNPEFIVQLHVVGYSKRDGRWEDFHCEPIQPDLAELLLEVLDYAPVRAIILERDEASPDPRQLVAELQKLHAFDARKHPHETQRCTRTPAD